MYNIIICYYMLYNYTLGGFESIKLIAFTDPP